MSNAERRSIINVLALYLTSTVLLVAVLAYGYYYYEKEQIDTQEKSLMLQNAKEIFNVLEALHSPQSFEKKYPRFEDINSAIYDIDKNLIFSTFGDEKINFDDNFYSFKNYLYLLFDVKPYYLGAAYIVIQKKHQGISRQLGLQIMFVTLFIVFILVLTSVFLVKLILKPIRDNLSLMDRFIKDTAHELNTPISTILTNIELIENNELDAKLKNKFNRIKTASLTISNIYEDLAFLILNHRVSTQNKTMNINTLLKQRLDYFAVMFKSKGLSLQVKEDGDFNLFIDNTKIVRLIDNLVSNAIKYTRRETTIKIAITNNSFSILDEGEGMTKEEIAKIFERYTRFDETQGGFGIGYNIVYTIVKEYNLDIDISSKLGEGTCVTITQ